MKNRFDWMSRIPKKNQLVLVLLFGILLIVIAMPTKEKEKEEEQEVRVQTTLSAESYCKKQEERLETLLREVEGAGKVRVMITFQNTGERVVEKDMERSDTKTGETTVYQSASSGEEIPYVNKEITPRAEGVVVIAEGGGSAIVIKNITEAVQALFDIDTHKIKVIKYRQTN